MNAGYSLLAWMKNRGDPQGNDALTIKPDHSVGAGQNFLRDLGLQSKATGSDARVLLSAA
jgi:hypothetical protein